MFYVMALTIRRGGLEIREMVSRHDTRKSAEAYRDLLVTHDTGNTLSQIVEYGVTMDRDSEPAEWDF